MKRTRLVFLALAALVLLSVPAFPASEVCSQPVATAQGPVLGEADPDLAACVWKGIPFAAPPVGELRWAAPAAPPARTQALQAVEFGPTCPQKESMLSGGVSGSLSEDCLYLNIWAPQKSGSFPVLFWIYGGGFISGSGSYDIYDGARVVSEGDVVVVTINYRVGALGFLALPELAAQDPHHSTGNYGLLDQIAALTWVHDNIAAFGGDPKNITIYGQSAGGMSVCALLTSPPAAGLFTRAFTMSGPCALMRTAEQAYTQGRGLAEAVGCAGPDSVACLRQKPVAAFDIKGHNDLFQLGVAYAPMVDGYALPDMPLTLIEQGRYQKVPVMIGTTREELRSYTMTIPGLGLITKGETNALLKYIIGPKFPEVREMYDYADYRRPIDLAFAFGNELVFESPGYRMAEAMVGQNPVYWYRFDWNQHRFPHKMGAFHALDVAFVFAAMQPDLALAKMLASKKMYEKNEDLGRTMASYVVSFARSGNPNYEGAPAWPAYTEEKRERLYFNTQITSAPLTEDQLRRLNYYRAHDISEMLGGRKKD